MNLVELQEVVNQMKIKYHHLFDNEFEDAYEISKRNCVENVGYLQALKRDNLKKLYIYLNQENTKDCRKMQRTNLYYSIVPI